MKWHLLAFVGVTALLGGCGGPAVELDALQRAIINGEPSGTDDDAAVGIGLFDDGGRLLNACSGVLVANNLVLTARHCVSQVENSGIACASDGTPIVGGGVVADYKPENMQILVGPELQFPLAATGQQLILLPSTTLCNADIAMLVLDRQIPNAPLAQLRLDKAPTTDETIRAVGWGVANDNLGLIRRKRDDIPIVLVGADDATGLAANEFMIGEGICSGDSGGPAFVESTKAVIGVVSRGGNGRPYDPNKDPAYIPCEDQGQYATQNTYTRTDSFKDFILTGFAAAGAEPWVEGGPDPRKAKFGEMCTADADCRSDVCLTAETAPTCSQACDAQTMCDAGFSCQKSGGRSVCKKKKKSGCSAAGDLESTSGALLLAALALLVIRSRVMQRGEAS